MLLCMPASQKLASRIGSKNFNGSSRLAEIVKFHAILLPNSTDHYLVIGGRDRQQNELLVRRYLNKGKYKFARKRDFRLIFQR